MRRAIISVLSSIQLWLAVLVFSTLLVPRTARAFVTLIPETTVTGSILDVSPERILYRVSTDPTAGPLYAHNLTKPNSLWIRNRSTGQDTLIKAEDDRFSVGTLTPRGALYTSQYDQSFTLYEWRDGQLLNHGLLAYNTRYAVKGNLAAWQASASSVIHNYTANTDTPLTAEGELEDIGPNGELVMSRYVDVSKRALVLIKNGVETSIAVDYLSGGARTDGTNVVYGRHNNRATQRIYFSTLYTPIGKVELTSGRSNVYFPLAGQSYEVNNGWTAWTRLIYSQGPLQVWLRNPQGYSKQISFYPEGASVSALSPNGQVVFASRDELYLADYDAPYVSLITPAPARAYFLPDGLYVSANGTLSFAAGTNNAEFVSYANVPSSMKKGSKAVVSVTMKNTGTSYWSYKRGFVLTSQNPQGNMNWGTNLRYLPAGVNVAPGQSHTFTFVATAPSTPGTYHFQWRMAQTGVEWFGAPSNDAVVTVTF